MAKGLGSLKALGRGLLAGLDSLARAHDKPVPEPRRDRGPLQSIGTEGLRVLQYRPALRHRGVPQQDYGVSALEQRAAQGIEGSLAERIVYKELERRQEQFAYDKLQPDQRLTVLGAAATFVVYTRVPNVALDVRAHEHDAEMGAGLKEAYLTGLGFRYAVLNADTDILPSQERLEDALTLLLGWAEPGPVTSEEPPL